MADPALSAALKEAYASAPVRDVVYHTLEIHHAAFTTPIRVVRDRVDLVARLEPGAPQNPGEEVVFSAFAFDLLRPEVSATGVPQCTVEIDNVSREILANIELAMPSIEAVRLTYREFLSSDLSRPQNDPPITLTLISISADVFKVRAVAGFSDFGNRRFPRDEYTAERFPGLVAQ